MEERTDIYHYETIMRSLDSYPERVGMSKKNQQIVARFKQHCFSRGLSKCRLIKYYYALHHLANFLGKDFDKAKKQDIELVVTQINANTKWLPATKHDHKVMLKRFYKWLYGNDEEYPAEVKWIKSKIKRTDKKLPNEGDLLTEEDVMKAINAANNLRDKALISTLYESGCRVGELASLRIRDVSFDKFGTVLSVTGKTGPRNIRIVSSTPYLANWINSHSLRANRDTPLFICIGQRNTGQKMTYDTIRVMIFEAFERAGIKKRKNPHIFRHSRATYLANFLTEFQMNQYFGWVQGSDMPSTYVHLSGKNIDNTILEINGLKKKEAENQLKMSKVCKRCDTINATGSMFCNKCGGVIDQTKALQLDEEMKQKNIFQNISNEALSKLMTEKPDLVLELIRAVTRA